MERVVDSAEIEFVYPHICFRNVSSNLHLLPFMAEGTNQNTAIMSYALRRGAVTETGPFLLNHLSITHLLYLGIDIELFKDEYTSFRFDNVDDLIKIATFKSQR